MSQHSVLKLWVPAIFLLSCGLVSADDLTERAKQLLDRGKANEAYSLLAPEESKHAGEPAYDLLLGISAVEIGQNTRAVFALERVLALQTDNIRARAEIARAYLALGESQVARQEFASVQKQNPPPEVSATIDRYLATVDRIESATSTSLRAYIEIGMGYDTNVNAGPKTDTIAVPAFGGAPFTLTLDSQANASGFGTLDGGLSLRLPLSSKLSFLGNLSGVFRKNQVSTVFDNAETDASAGFSYTVESNVYTLNAQHNRFSLNDNLYRLASGFSAQWQHNLDGRNQLTVFAQNSAISFETQAIRDTMRTTGGGAYAHAFRAGEIIFLSAYAVNENEDAANQPWLGLKGAGLRFGGQINWGERTTLFGNIAGESRRYGADDPLFLTTRKDTQTDVLVGVNHSPAKHWQIRSKLNWTRNSSNIALNDYTRQTVSLALRREF